MKTGLLITGLLLAACGGEFEVESIPMDDEFRVRAVVNGRPAHLDVDTGAMAGFFFADVREKLGLDVRKVEGRSVTVIDSTGAERTIRDFACDVEVVLGDAASRLDYLMCLPRVPHLATDGMIGMTIMSHQVLWFDLPGERMHVLSDELAESYLAGRGRKVATRLSLLGEPLRPYVRVEVSGKEVDLLVDTGAARSSLPVGVPTELGLVKQPDEVRRTKPDGTIVIEIGKHDGRSVGVHGEWTGSRPTYQLPELKLGSETVRDLVVGEDEEAKLGRDVLAAFGWILHGPRQELWLLVPE